MKKRTKLDARVPRYTQLIEPTFFALKALGGSGKNDEILNQIITDLKIPDEVADIQHKGRTNKSELSYQADWARTYLRIYGVIENSARSVWSIRPDYVSVTDLDAKKIVDTVTLESRKKRTDKNGEPSEPVDKPEDDDPTNDYAEYPDELKPWREQLAEILQNMDPYGFERLAQRVLRECGFTQVEVTKKSGDGGDRWNGKAQNQWHFQFQRSVSV